MEYLRKINIALALLLTTSAGYAYGDLMNSQECGERTRCLPCEPTCNISCQPACNVKGFISADFLYWRAFESGLDQCVATEVSDSITSTSSSATSSSSSDQIVVSRFTGEGRDPHFNWDPGFRIGAGYELGGDKWDIAVLWTHFHSHSSRDGNAFRWSINYDVIDIIEAYQCELGSCFTLRPYGGLRGARIDQKLRLNDVTSAVSSSFASFSGASLVDGPITTNSNNKQKFSGLGPLLGLEVDWKIGCGFSVYINLAASWLYGKFDIRQSELTESADTIDSFKVRKRLHASLAVGDAGFGFRWQTTFCNDIRLLLQLGFEHHRYFDYNRINGNYGDLSFDGLNLSAGLEF